MTRRARKSDLEARDFAITYLQRENARLRAALDQIKDRTCNYQRLDFDDGEQLCAIATAALDATEDTQP